MIKKVALISFFKSENYGAILQSFGLQRVLQSHCFEAYYLDYKRILRLSPLKRFIHWGYLLTRYLLGYWKRKKRTTLFREKYLNTSSFVKETDYDLYIVGSDQVWMPDYANDFFLLNFIKKKYKISYASSFGVSKLPESRRACYTESLSSFSAISTRERSGQQILQSLGFLDTHLVLDPTLLLSKEEWEDIAISPRLSYRYILCYVMNGDEETSKHVHSIARNLNAKNGFRYKVLTIGEKEYKSFLPSFNLICDAGPSEFLGFIRNADYIITSSFHGTCFSILFNKNFINVLRPDNPVNCRIEDLDSLLGLSSRVYYTDSQVVMPEFTAIDFEKVESLLTKYRSESLSYLFGTIDRLEEQ